jgi:pimeloyl-ACP methyl ester carboxylesterase
MGASDAPGGRFTFDRVADDLAEILDALSLEDVTLVGWSMGCSISLQHIARGAPRVGRLVLLNGPLRLTRADDFPHAMTHEELDAYVVDLVQRWPSSERSFQAASLLDRDPAVIDWLYQTALQTPLDVALTAVRAQAQLDHRQLIAELQVPVLAAYSKHDPYYPVSLGEWIAEAAPRGRLHVFENSAHCTPFEEAAAFAEVVSAFAVDWRS